MIEAGDRRKKTVHPAQLEVDKNEITIKKKEKKHCKIVLYIIHIYNN